MIKALSSVPLLNTKEEAEQDNGTFLSQSGAIVEMLAAGQKNRMLLLHKIFGWLSKWTLEFPVTDQKWAQYFLAN